MENIEYIGKKIVTLLKPINPDKIILFGSYVYGKPTENSDLDICIIKEKVESKISEKRKVRKLLKDIAIAKDILIPSKSEFEFYKNEHGSVYMDIDKKGKVLWPVI